MDKRARRRLKREAEFGPERVIMSTEDGVHTLSCGHKVTVVETERHNIRERRCIHCKMNITICFIQS